MDNHTCCSGGRYFRRRLCWRSRHRGPYNDAAQHPNPIGHPPIATDATDATVPPAKDTTAPQPTNPAT